MVMGQLYMASVSRQSSVGSHQWSVISHQSPVVSIITTTTTIIVNIRRRLGFCLTPFGLQVIADGPLWGTEAGPGPEEGRALVLGPEV